MNPESLIFDVDGTPASYTHLDAWYVCACRSIRSNSKTPSQIFPCSLGRWNPGPGPGYAGTGRRLAKGIEIG